MHSIQTEDKLAQSYNLRIFKYRRYFNRSACLSVGLCVCGSVCLYKTDFVILTLLYFIQRVVSEVTIFLGWLGSDHQVVPPKFSDRVGLWLHSLLSPKLPSSKVVFVWKSSIMWDTFYDIQAYYNLLIKDLHGLYNFWSMSGNFCRLVIILCGNIRTHKSRLWLSCANLSSSWG